MPRLPDDQVTLQDARRLVARLRRLVGRFPALRLLIDSYPEDDDDLNLPGREEDDAAGDEEDLGDEESLSATLSEILLARRFLLGPGDLAGGYGNLFDPAEETRSGAALRFLVQFEAVEVFGAWFDSWLSGRLAATDPRRAALDAAKEVYRETVGAATDRFVEGEISRLEWLRVVRSEVKDLHISAGVAGRGGAWSDMTFSDWGRLGQKIREQYGYADNFARDLLTKEYSAGQMKTRLGLYADAASSSFEAASLADVGIDPSVLRFFPGDGTTNCLTRCKCRWSIRILSKKRGDYNATWRLGAAEHCKTCLSRAREWRSIKVRGGSLLAPINPIVRDR